MKKLDNNAFLQLQSLLPNQVLTAPPPFYKPNWYELSYPIFIEAPLNSISDFWKLVAMTYSWMPTIPNISAHLLNDEAALLKNLQDLRNGDTTKLKEIILELIPIINNSLTGTSKLLHFVNSNEVPIIDSNVLRGWEIFVSEFGEEFKLPKLPSSGTSLNSKHIDDYLLYRTILKDWSSNCNGDVTLRDIELVLFDIGRITPKPKKFIEF